MTTAERGCFAPPWPPCRCWKCSLCCKPHLGVWAAYPAGSRPFPLGFLARPTGWLGCYSTEHPLAPSTPPPSHFPLSSFLNETWPSFKSHFPPKPQNFRWMESSLVRSFSHMHPHQRHFVLRTLPPNYFTWVLHSPWGHVSICVYFARGSRVSGLGRHIINTLLSPNSSCCQRLIT